MSRSVPIRFQLNARVNGESFSMNGDGQGSQTEGTCELHLTADPKFPEGFDPVSCPNICSHPTSSFFSRAVSEGIDFPTLTAREYHVQPARIGTLHDARGTELLNLQVSGTVRMDGGVLISAHEMTGTSRLPRLDRNVTPFDDFILPSSAGEATALVRFKVLTADGELLDGKTIVPYRWNGAALAMPLVRRVELVHVEWDGAKRVSAYYRTSIRPMTMTEARHEVIDYPFRQLPVSAQM